MLRSIACCAMWLLLGTSPAWCAPPRVAFPEAEGAGALSQGGRGGKVIYVTTLEDGYGKDKKPLPGSLRAAIEAAGPRIVLFQVGGVIELKRGLVIREPQITIAGQTAPGDGICLKNYSLGVVNTHDVVIRHLRVRPGDTAGKEMDGISVLQSQRAIIDHCSVSWSIDEALSVTGEGCTDVSVQWCCIAEGLNESVHSKGAHGYGSLIRTDGQVSYHHNLYAHFKTRCPRPGTYGNAPGQLDFRNNVIYDWDDPPGYSAEDPAKLNYVGNYLRPGPSTRDARTAFDIGGKETAIFAADNIMEGKTVATPWELIRKIELGQKLNAPLPLPEVKTSTARETFQTVLAGCGATRPRRDAVDTRIIQDVIGKQGKIINSQTEVGGWPAYRSAAAEPDADADGLPDSWERKHRLNPQDPADAQQDADRNGYPDLEDYLNELAG